MKAPKDQYVIQIDVTNACVHACSNCTRFCGHHKKPFFMEYETFCKAVDSLIDHPGLIGVMGGEPTLHPRFKDMCRYLQSTVGKRHELRSGIMSYPTDQLVETRRRFELDEYEIEEYEDAPRPIIKGTGLWTSLTTAYLKNYEIIQDTFHFQSLNDHSNVSLHQPILISRKELGIGDEEWYKLREKCWVNHEWSGSITPKGCFFCEVAASFDMLYDGPGGLPIEKDWWKRDISDYKEQFRWCEMCGIPLKTFSRDAREEIDDISPYHYEKFQSLEKICEGKKKLNVLDIQNNEIKEDSMKAVREYRGQTYINDAQMRVSSSTPIYARKFYGILIDDGSSSEKELKDSIKRNRHFFENIILFTNRLYTDEKNGVEVKSVVYNEENTFEKIKEAVGYFGDGKYIILYTPDILFGYGLDILKKCAINPGTLHYIDFSTEIEEKQNDYISNADSLAKGFCILMNNRAISYQNLDCNRNSIYQCIGQMKEQWDKKKVVEFSNQMNRNIYHTAGREKSIKSNRTKNVMRMLYRFDKKYGFWKTVKYGVSMVRHYGIKMTIGKLKSRIY